MLCYVLPQNAKEPQGGWKDFWSVEEDDAEGSGDAELADHVEHDDQRQETGAISWNNHQLTMLQ